MDGLGTTSTANFQPNIEPSKMRSADRVLTLKIKDKSKPRDVLGMTDPSLFKTGGNKLHAIMNKETCLWNFKYEMGDIPGPMKQSFTSFGRALAYAKGYYSTRNIEVIEIID